MQFVNTNIFCFQAEKEKKRMKKTDDILIVRGIGEEAKAELQKIALQKFGKKNISALVRELIAAEIDAVEKQKSSPDLSSKMRRVQISIPESCLQQIEQIADSRFSTPSFFITTLIYEKLGVKQFQVDEVEALRISNYSLAKIGNNLNQIARAFNATVLAQGAPKLPPISRDIEKLKIVIREHTEKVLDLLNKGTVIMESRVRGGKSKTPKDKPVSRTRNSRT